jgi:RNA polymerase sigma-B factor
MSTVHAAPAPASPRELFARCREDHDQRAREQLIIRFLPLAYKLAARYSASRGPDDDLVQVASVGLVQAVDRFDPGRGTSFTSFAVPTIIGELKRYFRDAGWSVHVPRGAQEHAVKVTQARQQLVAQGSHPTAQEIADHLGWTVEDVLNALETSAAHRTVSLQTPSVSEAANRQIFAQPDDQFELVEARASIAAAAEQLSARQRRVLALRFVSRLTLSQIADAMGISRAQASRLLHQALDQLRVLTAG